MISALQKYRRFPRVYLRNIFLLGILFSDWILPWQILIPYLNVEAPAMAVISGSMEPSYYRGDVVAQYASNYEVTDQTVFSSKKSDREYPIIHRLFTKVTNKKTKQVQVLTWGDNNGSPDSSLYDGPGPLADYSNLVSKGVGSCSQIGYFSILYQENPLFKLAVWISIGLAIEGGNHLYAV